MQLEAKGQSSRDYGDLILEREEAMAAPSALPGGQLWDLLGQWWHDGHCCLGGLQDWLSSPPGVCAVLSVHPPFCLNQLRFLLLGTTKLILPPRLYYL